MDPALVQIVHIAAKSENLKVDPSAFKHIENYDAKFKDDSGDDWDSPVIQAVLADSAIKIAKVEGHTTVTVSDAQSAVWGWKPEGDLTTKCRKAGKRIIRGVREENLMETLNPAIATYVQNTRKDWGQGQTLSVAE
jgi:hypothetical protein